MIEGASATAVAWQFSGNDPEAREKTAPRVIAVSFFALAAYVTVESARALFGAGEAQPSTVGIVLAALSLLIMPGLSYAQRRTGRELGLQYDAHGHRSAATIQRVDPPVPVERAWQLAGVLDAWVRRERGVDRPGP